MEQQTVNFILAIVAIGSLISSAAQFFLSAKGRKSAAGAHDSEAKSSDADAIESLTRSVSASNSRIDELQRRVDCEIIARRIAENKLQDLTRRIVILEIENTALKLENTALKDALDLK